MELREQHIQLATQSAEARENWEEALLARRLPRLPLPPVALHPFYGRNLPPPGCALHPISSISAPFLGLGPARPSARARRRRRRLPKRAKPSA